ncbi:MAG: cation:proton antiporter [Bacteroidetes bacterium]|nr:cation:proton antiporter [Bacteroidota bacterium]
MFFASIGLQVDVIAHFDIVLVLIVLLIASIGKIPGSIVASRMMGFKKRESLAIGFGMNARGRYDTPYEDLCGLSGGTQQHGKILV